MDETLSIEPLRKAAASLEAALAEPYSDIVRDSVIQRFEYTFELAWKTLRRVLLWNYRIEPIGIRGIFREAAKYGFIADSEQWLEFHQARNLTSHAYNEATAERVFETAREFSASVTALLEKLEQSLG